MTKTKTKMVLEAKMETARVDQKWKSRAFYDILC